MTTAQSDYAARVRAAGAAYYPMTAFNGREFTRTFTFKGVDYSAATFRGQVRSRPDAGGSALAAMTVTPVLSGSDTVVTAVIGAAAIAALPAAAEPGTAALFFYDLTIARAGDAERTFAAGEFYRVGSIVA